MQNKAWTYTMTAMILGAGGLMIRWLQCEAVFDKETGLPTQGAALSIIMGIVLAMIVAVLWWLSGKAGCAGTSREPEIALASPNKELVFLIIFAALICAMGSLLMFFTEESIMMRIVALLGLLSAFCFAVTLFLPNWGGFGALLSVIPVVYLSLWLVMFYKTNVVNPIVWSYCVQVLAITACLGAAFRVCGYMFYRINPRRTIFSCGLALAFCLCVIMDDASTASRLLYAGWGVGFGAIAWAIIANFAPPVVEEEEDY